MATKKTSSPRSPRSPHPLLAAAVGPCPDAYGGSNLSMSLENSREKTLSLSALRATPTSAARATPPFPSRPAPPAQASPAYDPSPAQPWVTVATAPPQRPPRFSSPAGPPHAARAAPFSPLAQPHASSTPVFVAPCLLNLPRVPARAGSTILTLAAARAALAAPASVSSATLAEAHSLVRTVGNAIRLDPRTGEPVAPPPAITAYGIAPDAQLAAFPSFAAAQSALLRGAHLAGTALPPHVIVPGVGRWTYIYLLASHTPLFIRILSHLRLVYEDLDVQTAPLPPTASALDTSAAAGVVCRLRREALRLLDSRTPTSVSLPVRQAMAITLQAQARAIAPRPGPRPASRSTPPGPSSRATHPAPPRPTAPLPPPPSTNGPVAALAAVAPARASTPTSPTALPLAFSHPPAAGPHAPPIAIPVRTVPSLADTVPTAVVNRSPPPSALPTGPPSQLSPPLPSPPISPDQRTLPPSPYDAFPPLPVRLPLRNHATSSVSEARAGDADAATPPLASANPSFVPPPSAQSRAPVATPATPEASPPPTPAEASSSPPHLLRKRPLSFSAELPPPHRPRGSNASQQPGLRPPPTSSQ